ncbi:MAG: Calx-beta domain-containing protein, partial [Acidobacteriota bacterium]
MIDSLVRSLRPLTSGLAPALAILSLAAPAAFANAPFSGDQTIQTIAGANSIAAGDLDGSPGADIFHGIESAQVLTLVFQDPLDTWTPQTLTPGNRMRDVAIADLDGDGDNDLIYGDYNGNQVFWRENDLDTTGVFLARIALATGIGNAQGLDIADVDSDGDLDVLVAGRNADAYFFLENDNGDASAWTRRTIATGVNAAQVIVAADLDGDGDLDAAGGSSSGSGKLAWYENVTGDGTSWLSRDIYSSRFAAVAAGDLDLDGDQDLLVQDIGATDIIWLENTAGDGTAWTQRQISSFSTARRGLQAVDLDFDGDLDVIGDPNGDWWENIDKATSWTRRSYSNDTNVTDTVVADLDGDGDQDIAAARSTAGQITWWENLTCSPDDADDDADGVRNACDVCPGFDDTLDADGDLTPDGCDVCPGFDDRVDVDSDGTPDACGGSASIAIDNVTAAEGDAGTTDFTFTVTLTGSAGAFTVGYATQDQSAIAGDDYTPATGTLSFAGTDGETQTLTVLVTGDETVEESDVFDVVLGAPSDAGVSVSDDTGAGSIFNDDTTAMSIDDPPTAEGDSGTTPLVYTVGSTHAVEGGFTIDFVSGDNAATVADGDYLPTSGTLNFTGLAGETHTVTLQVVGDTALEADERVNILLRNPSRTTILVPDGVGRGLIVNDDFARLTVDDVSQVEGDAGTATYTFTVSLTGADVPGGFTVPFQTADGTASAGSDYAPAAGTLTFAGTDGETQTLTVTVNGDTALEPDETFAVELGAPSTPGIQTVDGTGTIQNNDSASLAIGDVSQLESDAGATFQFVVSLTGEVAGGFTVPFQTVDGTASSTGGDFTAASGTVSFTGGANEIQTIDVSITGDATVEADEGFTVELGTPSNAGVSVTDAVGAGTVQNDDSATLAIDDVRQSETDAGTTFFTFTVTLSGDVDGGFTVPFQTADGTASSASDYTADTDTLSFAGSDGETQTIRVAVSGDATVESDETFTVTLGAPSNADVSAPAGPALGTIQNDDSATVAID